MNWTGPWWSSGLERHSHGVLDISRSRVGIPVIKKIFNYLFIFGMPRQEGINSPRFSVWDKKAWKDRPSKWTDGRTLHWQLPILQRWNQNHQWNGQMDVPSSREIPILWKKYFYAFLSGKMYNSHMPRPDALALLTGLKTWLVQDSSQRGKIKKILKKLTALAEL